LKGEAEKEALPSFSYAGVNRIRFEGIASVKEREASQTHARSPLRKT